MIVDDEKPVRIALERLLRSAGYHCSLFANRHDLFQYLPVHEPGCILLDLRLAETSGLDVQADLHNRGCNLPVIFMSAYGSIKTSVNAMKGGAVDFLTKPIEEEQLFQAIEKSILLHRKRLIQNSIIEYASENYSQLTPREKEVMSYVISGARIKIISSHLGISEKTLKIHKARIMEKMQAESVVDLYRTAGLLKIKPNSAL